MKLTIPVYKFLFKVNFYISLFFKNIPFEHKWKWNKKEHEKTSFLYNFLKSPPQIIHHGGTCILSGQSTAISHLMLWEHIPKNLLNYSWKIWDTTNWNHFVFIHFNRASSRSLISSFFKNALKLMWKKIRGSIILP